MLSHQLGKSFISKQYFGRYKDNSKRQTLTLSFPKELSSGDFWLSRESTNHDVIYGQVYSLSGQMHHLIQNAPAMSRHTQACLFPKFHVLDRKQNEVWDFTFFCRTELCIAKTKAWWTWPWAMQQEQWPYLHSTCSYQSAHRCVKILGGTCSYTTFTIELRRCDLSCCTCLCLYWAHRRVCTHNSSA